MTIYAEEIMKRIFRELEYFREETIISEIYTISEIDDIYKTLSELETKYKEQ